MTQSLVIKTPDMVSSTSRTFPKQGMFNLKITKNGTYDTVEIWFRCEANNITLELAGASFQSTAQVVAPKTIPPTPTVISGSTLALTPVDTHYMKIKLNNGISVAHLRCSYTARSANATVTGGNIRGQAFVDYSRLPYVSVSLDRMFAEHPVQTDLTKWDTSSVINFKEVFLNNTTFNQPINNWDVSNATDMRAMFRLASSFNQPINNWDVSKVSNMRYMFASAFSFDQDLSNWDVSNVAFMEGMFANTSSFDQDLSNWAAKFNVNVNLDMFFADATWGTTHYDKFLNALWADISFTRPQAWALRTTSKLLGMGTSKYSAASAPARNSLVSLGWTITDGGLAA